MRKGIVREKRVANYIYVMQKMHSTTKCPLKSELIKDNTFHVFMCTESLEVRKK